MDIYGINGFVRAYEDRMRDKGGVTPSHRLQAKPVTSMIYIVV